eukprot:2619681-Prymnesium_polylepis.2
MKGPQIRATRLSRAMPFRKECDANRGQLSTMAGRRPASRAAQTGGESREPTRDHDAASPSSVSDSEPCFAVFVRPLRWRRHGHTRSCGAGSAKHLVSAIRKRRHEPERETQRQAGSRR